MNGGSNANLFSPISEEELAELYGSCSIPTTVDPCLEEMINNISKSLSDIHVQIESRHRQAQVLLDSTEEEIAQAGLVSIAKNLQIINQVISFF